MVGRTITHYKILDKVGEGGMGVVYAAEDTKLHRTVALKFIRPDAVENQELKARFLNEAEAAAALSHPGICIVHEIDETDNRPFIAMEYLKGESLATRIRKRPLPLDEALDIAVQVAEGLQAAHEKGITHRDIKPANIMIDAKGRTKIMDFGLAHLEEATKITRTGTSLGTPAYMSPEQVRGEEVDHRADNWSLGVVLYEMLAGQLPFRGEVKEAVSHSILYDEPEPLTALRSGLPTELDRITHKALAKDREERYPHVEDMLVDLRELRRGTESSLGMKRVPGERSVPARTDRTFGVRRLVPWAMAGLAAVAAVYLWSPWRSATLESRTPVRFAAALPEGETIDLAAGESLEDVGGFGSPLALSRDGSKLVYVARRGKVVQLYLRPLGEYESTAIPGTEGARAPFFSPDGNWVGFARGGKVYKVSLLGGAPQMICPLNVAMFGGDWGPDDTALLGDCSTGLTRVATAGGAPELVTSVNRNAWGENAYADLQHQFPQLLPGGKAVLLTVWNGPEDTAIAVLDLEAGTRRRVVEPGTYGRYVSTGHLVYAWDGNLLAAPFDLDELKVSGPSLPVVKGVSMELWRGAAYFTVSENGTLSYVPGNVMASRKTLVWVDRNGSEELLPFEPGQFANRVSPDGKHIVVSRPNEATQEPELWIYELDRGIQRRFANSPGGLWWALWSPDSKNVIYNSVRSGDSAFLYSKTVDGSVPERQLTSNGILHIPYSFSADGRLLAFQESEGADQEFNISVLSMEGDRRPQPFVCTTFSEIHPALSPDGCWLAYASDEPGRWEVMLRSYPGPGGVTQVSIDGGREPLWSRDGRELYYRRGSRLMAVSVEMQGASPTVGKPRLVFEGRYMGGLKFGRTYDLHPDGERFLMVKMPEPPPSPTQYRLVVNWFDELNRLVPTTD